MFEDRRDKCHAIIHGASAATAAIGAGLAQIPLADSIPITAAQVGMIVSIAKVYDVDISEGAAKGLLAWIFCYNCWKKYCCCCCWLGSSYR